MGLKCVKSWILYQTHTERHCVKFCEGQKTKNPSTWKAKLRILWKRCSKWEVVHLENRIPWKLEQIHKRYRERNGSPPKLVYLGRSDIAMLTPGRTSLSLDHHTHQPHQGEVCIDPEMKILEFTWFPHFSFLWTSKHWELPLFMSAEFHRWGLSNTHYRPPGLIWLSL